MKSAWGSKNTTLPLKTGLGGKVPMPPNTMLKNLVKGAIFHWFICAEYKGEYRMFYIGNRDTLEGVNIDDEVSGQIVTNDYQFEEKMTFKKGHFTKLRLGCFTTTPLYHPGTKVLALKPNNEDFEKKFSFAKVVSGPNPEKRTIALSRPPPNREHNRSSYMLLFDGETQPRRVFEEMIVPIKKYWGKEKEEYKPSTDSSSDSSSSDSESESSSESDSSSSESEDKKKHKSHKKHSSHKNHGKHNKKHNKKHHHHNKPASPRIVIMPIFIPMPQYQQLQYGYSPY